MPRKSKIYAFDSKIFEKSYTPKKMCQSIGIRCVRALQFMQVPDIDIAISGNYTNHREAHKLGEQIKQVEKPRVRCKRSHGDDNEAR